MISYKPELGLELSSFVWGSIGNSQINQKVAGIFENRLLKLIM